MIILLTFANERERNKFEYLYEKYKNLLFHKAWEILHDHMLAEDAVSEAYLRVYRNLDKIEDPDSPRSAAFLVTIVRNAALTLYKRSKGMTLLADDEDTDESADPVNLEEQVISGIATERIYAIVETLDEETRNIFVLKYAYDLSHGEIARQLNITENNVTVRLHRTKKKLAGLIAVSADPIE